MPILSGQVEAPHQEHKPYHRLISVLLINQLQDPVSHLQVCSDRLEVSALHQQHKIFLEVVSFLEVRAPRTLKINCIRTGPRYTPFLLQMEIDPPVAHLEFVLSRLHNHIPQPAITTPQANLPNPVRRAPSRRKKLFQCASNAAATCSTRILAAMAYFNCSSHHSHEFIPASIAPVRTSLAQQILRIVQSSKQHASYFDTAYLRQCQRIA